MEAIDNNSWNSVICIDLEDDDDDEIIELPPPNTSLQQQEELHTLQSIESTDAPARRSKDSNLQRKVIQQCLALLLHAQRCNVLHEESSEVQIKCVQPHCNRIKDLLKHQENCQLKQQCSVPRCSSFRMILRHWDNCKRGNCPLCSSLRRRFNVEMPAQRQESENVSKKSKGRLSVPPNFGNNNQLLPNPFAGVRSARSLQGESWDDNPAEVPVIPQSEKTGVSERSSNTPMFFSTPKVSGKNSTAQFEWTSALSRESNWKRHSDDSRPNKRTKHRSFDNSTSSNYMSSRRKYRNPSFEPETQRQPKHSCNSRSDLQISRASIDSTSDESLKTTSEMKKHNEIKMTREQMQMLIHAFKCRRNDAKRLSSTCVNPTCRSTKHLLDHIKDCERTLDCWVPRCMSSKRILIHVNECRDKECELCSTVSDAREGDAINRPPSGVGINNY